jgi:hypothetical protein
MIWLKRQFRAADYAPYQDILEKLLTGSPTRYAEFLMVCTNTEDPLVSDYFVGMPDDSRVGLFHGFQRIAESDLPKEIDTFLLGDQTKQPFTSRFSLKKR